MIIAGNLLIDRDSESSAVTGPAVATAAITSETPEGVVFQLGSLIDAHQTYLASVEAAKAQAKLDARLEKKKEERELKEKFDDLPGSVTPETLEAIADCESGGDPNIVSSNGLYHGKYQFHPDTWESVGGKGLPSEAPEAEQDYRAALLYERSGPGQWPVCGQ
ncbi:MAG: transglycosylase family protein [Solirubrobacterales bacterium]|nr:transglycosylase family protein [Solirubrobacterales bacterium]HMT04731.1 transglycosylase family protein [Solirubrobacterales bacterium]